jgi:hypothetical protein
MSLLLHASHAPTFLFCNSYIGPPINGSIIFTPDIRFPHARRSIRAGTRSSLAAATTVAHFSDDRGRIQTRMVNGTLEISLSLFLSLFLARVLLSTVQESGVRFPRASMPFRTLAFYRRCRRLLFRSRSCRSAVISSPPIFPLPGLAAAYRTGTHSDQ